VNIVLKPDPALAIEEVENQDSEECFIELRTEHLKEKYSLTDKQVQRLEEIVTYEESLETAWEALENALAEYSVEKGEIHSAEFLTVDHVPQSSAPRSIPGS